MAGSRRGPTRLMSIVSSLKLADFVGNAVLSRFVTSTGMPPGDGGNREETDCHATVNIREIVMSTVKNILSKFGADD